MNQALSNQLTCIILFDLYNISESDIFFLHFTEENRHLENFACCKWNSNMTLKNPTL